MSSVSPVSPLLQNPTSDLPAPASTPSTGKHLQPSDYVMGAVAAVMTVGVMGIGLWLWCRSEIRPDKFEALGDTAAASGDFKTAISQYRDALNALRYYSSADQKTNDRRSAIVSKLVDAHFHDSQYFEVLDVSLSFNRYDLFQQYFDPICETLRQQGHVQQLSAIVSKIWSIGNESKLPPNLRSKIEHEYTAALMDWAKVSEAALTESSSAKEVLSVAALYDTATANAQALLGKTQNPSKNRVPAERIVSKGILSVASTSAARLYVRAAELLSPVAGASSPEVARLYAEAARNFMRTPGNESVAALQSLLRAMPVDFSPAISPSHTLILGAIELQVSRADALPSGLKVAQWVVKNTYPAEDIQAHLDLATQMFINGQFGKATTLLKSLHSYAQMPTAMLPNPLGGDRVPLNPIEAALIVFHRQVSEMKGQGLAFDTVQAAMLAVADAAWDLNGVMRQRANSHSFRPAPTLSILMTPENALAAHIAEVIRSNGAPGATGRAAAQLAELSNVDLAIVSKTLRGKPSSAFTIEEAQSLVPERVRRGFGEYLTRRQTEVAAPVEGRDGDRDPADFIDGEGLCIEVP